MTIDQIREPDDAELDVFLRGAGDVSPRLKRLSQPSPPPEVTAAVMAEIEAALIEEKNAAAAATNNTRLRRQSRWAMPVAFAASVLVGMMIHTQWRAAQDRNEAAVAQAPAEIPLPTSIAENKPAASGESLAAAPSDSRPSSKPAHVTTPEKPAQIASITAAEPKAAPPVRVAAAETQTVVTTGIRASLQQSMNVKRKETTNVEVVIAEDAGKMPDKNVADTLQRLPGVSITAENKENPTPLEQKRNAVNDVDVYVNDNGASLYGGRAGAATPAPAVAAPAALPAESEQPKAWLNRIEKKIELGEDRDALEEWAKFRKAYPDFTVPEKLAEKIKALQQK